MMKALTISVLLALAILTAVSQTVTNRIPVEVPKGIVLATKAQRTFVSTLTNLSLGATKLEVEQKLGKPNEAEAKKWYYRLGEDSNQGGFFISARLVFLSNGLASAKLDFGHETKQRR